MKNKENILFVLIFGIFLFGDKFNTITSKDFNINPTRFIRVWLAIRSWRSGFKLAVISWFLRVQKYEFKWTLRALKQDLFYCCTDIKIKRNSIHIGNTPKWFRYFFKISGGIGGHDGLKFGIKWKNMAKLVSIIITCSIVSYFTSFIILLSFILMFPLFMAVIPTDYNIGGDLDVGGNFSVTGTNPTGRACTKTVAASDSEATAILQSDYQCDGVRGSLLIEDCEDAWGTAQGGLVVCTADADSKVGVNSAKMAVAAGAGTGLLATEDFAQINLNTNGHTAKFASKWIKSSVSLDAGDMKLHLSSQAACGGAPNEEEIVIPAMLRANSWEYMRLPLANPASDTAIISAGIEMVVDKGAFDLYIDDVKQTWGDEDFINAAVVASNNGMVKLFAGTYYIHSQVEEEASILYGEGSRSRYVNEWSPGYEATIIIHEGTGNAISMGSRLGPAGGERCPQVRDMDIKGTSSTDTLVYILDQVRYADILYNVALMGSGGASKPDYGVRYQTDCTTCTKTRFFNVNISQCITGFYIDGVANNTELYAVSIGHCTTCIHLDGEMSSFNIFGGSTESSTTCYDLAFVDGVNIFGVYEESNTNLFAWTSDTKNVRVWVNTSAGWKDTEFLPSNIFTLYSKHGAAWTHSFDNLPETIISCKRTEVDEIFITGWKTADSTGTVDDDTACVDGHHVILDAQNEVCYHSFDGYKLLKGEYILKVRAYDTNQVAGDFRIRIWNGDSGENKVYITTALLAAWETITIPFTLSDTDTNDNMRMECRKVTAGANTIYVDFGLSIKPMGDSSRHMSAEGYPLVDIPPWDFVKASDINDFTLTNSAGGGGTPEVDFRKIAGRNGIIRSETGALNAQWVQGATNVNEFACDRRCRCYFIFRINDVSESVVRLGFFNAANELVEFEIDAGDIYYCANDGGVEDRTDTGVNVGDNEWMAVAIETRTDEDAFYFVKNQQKGYYAGGEASANDMYIRYRITSTDNDLADTDVHLDVDYIDAGQMRFDGYF